MASIKYGRGNARMEKMFKGIKTEPKKAKRVRAEPEWTFEQLRGSGAYTSGREGWYE
jgi:hypothetical protein